MAHRPLGLAPFDAAAGSARRRLGTRRAAWPGFWAWLLAHLLEERERWFLWLPVGLGCGIMWYFALPAEPPVLAGIAARSCWPLRWRAAGDLPAKAGRRSRSWPGRRRERCCRVSRWRRCARARRGARAGAAWRLPDRGHRAAGGGSGAGSAADARAAGDRGPRARSHAGAGQGERAAGRPGGGAGRSDPSAGHAHAAVGAGRAARLRLRPLRLFHAARRGRLRLGPAGPRFPGRQPQLVSCRIRPAPVDRERDQPGRPGRRRAPSRCAPDRAARRSLRPDLGRVGGGRHHRICCQSPAFTWRWSPAPCSSPSGSRWRWRRRSSCGCRPRSWPRSSP